MVQTTADNWRPHYSFINQLETKIHPNNIWKLSFYFTKKQWFSTIRARSLIQCNENNTQLHTVPTVCQSYLTSRCLLGNHCEVTGYVRLYQELWFYKTKVLDTKNYCYLLTLIFLPPKYFPSPLIVRSVTHNTADKLTVHGLIIYWTK